MPGINWRELGRRVGERSRLGQGLGLAIQLGSGGHDYRPEQEMERQRERTYERNLEAYLGRQKAKAADEAGDEAFKAEQQRERLDAAAERARLAREGQAARQAVSIAARPPKVTPPPRPPTQTDLDRQADARYRANVGELRDYEETGMGEDEDLARQVALDPSRAAEKARVDVARVTERAAREGARVTHRDALEKARAAIDAAQEVRAENRDKRDEERLKAEKERLRLAIEAAGRAVSEAEKRWLYANRAALGARVGRLQYASFGALSYEAALSQAIAELKAEQAAAPALVAPAPRPEGDTAADDTMDALRKAAPEETPSPGGKPGAGGPAAAGAFEAGPQPMVVPPFASGASGAPTAAGLPTAMLPPKPALDLPGIRLEPQNEGDQPVYSNRATELAVSLLRRKDVDERIRALAELRANPEQFRQRGVDVDSVLAAFEGR